MYKTVNSHARTARRIASYRCHKNRGLSLIELLVTLVIVAFLAAVAFPAYSNYVVRGEIRTAQADLLALSLSLENRYQRTLAYPTLDASNASTTAQLQLVLTNWNPGSAAFGYSAVSDGTGYTLTATGSDSRLSGCALTLDDANTRDSTGCRFTGGSWL